MTYRNQNSVNDVGQYQMSGLPFVTASVIAANTTVKVEFPFVTKFVTVKTITPAASLRVGFTANGVLNTNYTTSEPSRSFSADLRVRELYLRVQNGTSVEYQVIAGLTTINSGTFPVLTGSTPSDNTNFVYSYPGIG